MSIFVSVQFSDLEKEKTMIELEVKELIARHKSDMLEKGAQISQLEELNQQLTDNLGQKMSEKDELNAKIKGLQEGKWRFLKIQLRIIDENWRIILFLSKSVSLVKSELKKKYGALNTFLEFVTYLLLPSLQLLTYKLESFMDCCIPERYLHGPMADSWP